MKRIFEERDRAEVLATLAGASLSEPVAIAVIRLSRGRAARIPGLLQHARRDYRDVLAWVQQPSRTYIAGVLRKGPNWTGRVTHLQLRSLQSWKSAGRIIIGGLFRDDTVERGLYIFACDSVDEAQALAAEDPGIESGELAFDFHRWISADGLQVGPPFGHDL